MRYLVFIACIATARAHAGTLAQETSAVGLHVSGALLDRAPGVRSSGMGQAFVAVADDSTAVWWNPGGLAQLRSVHVGLETASEIKELSTRLFFLSTAFPIGPGVAGLNVTQLQLGSYEVRDENGRKLGDEALDELTTCIGWGMPSPAWWPLKGSVGVAIEMARDGVKQTTMGLTVGMLADISRVRCGLAIRHIGIPSRGYAPPLAISLGPSGYLIAGLRGALDLSYGLVDRIFGVGAGLEWRPTRGLAVRGGYGRRGQPGGLVAVGGPTLGLGFRVGALGLDYAFQSFGDVVTAHKVALVYGRLPGS